MKVTTIDPAGNAEDDGLGDVDGGTDGDAGRLGDGLGTGARVGVGLTAAGVAFGVATAVAGATVEGAVATGEGDVRAVHALATSAARQQVTKTMRDTEVSLLVMTAGSDGRGRADVPQQPKGQKVSGHQASAAE